jgi:outer membrane protein assembly factor BamB
MKIQCNCGAKYSFDVTPEMVRSPIRFVCQACGQDSSEMVNQLIRQQLGVAAGVAPSVSGVAPPVAIAPPPAHLRASAAVAPAITPNGSAPPPAPPRVAPGVAVRTGDAMVPPAGATPALRVSGHATAGQAAAAAAPAVSAPQTCAKHAGQLAAQQCRVCGKPMCPKCMESFGYVCSAYCKGKAENQGIHLPAYAGQRQYAESRQSRKLTLILGAVMGGVVLFLGAWGWYAWVGSVPKVAFSLRLPEPGYSGQLRILPADQAVFLHGGRLVRHDLKAKKEVWSNLLLDKKRIADEAAASLKRMTADREKAVQSGIEFNEPLPSLEELIDSMERATAGAMHLHVRGDNVWVSFPDKLVRFDWQSGQSAKEVSLNGSYDRLVSSDDELQIEMAQNSVTRLNLLSGETRTEQASRDQLSGPPVRTTARSATTTGQQKTAAPSATNPPVNASGQAVIGARSAESIRSQNLSTPARAALPAVTAANANQQRLVNEMKGQSAVKEASPSVADSDGSRLFASAHGVFQLSARAGASRVIDGETIRMHRVVLRRVGVQENAEWTGEIPGSPELYPLKTVDVLAGEKNVTVLSKANKKLWEAKLKSILRIPARSGIAEDEAVSGDGPCVERDDTLYIFDGEGITSFELNTGTVRWHAPSSGTLGLFFDDKGMIYVNSMVAGADKAMPLVRKLDPKTGKELWSVQREGSVSYVSGKFVYTTEAYKGDDDEADGLPGVRTIFHVPAYVKIKRLDADNGRILWHHHQERFPLDVQFDRNSIRFLFKKEVQILKFVSL